MSFIIELTYKQIIHWREADFVEAKLRLTSPTTATSIALKIIENLKAAIDWLKALLG